MNGLRRPKSDILDLLIAREYRQTLEQVHKETKQEDNNEVTLVYQCKGE